MATKTIVIDTGSDSNRLMMSDVVKSGNTVQTSILYSFRSRFDELLFKIHFGFKLNKYFDLPFKSIWDHKCILKLYSKSDYLDEVNILLVNDVIRKLSPTLLRKLTKKPNVHLYLLLLDSYDKMQPYFRRCVSRVNKEYVYSFQYSDCRKYGFTYSEENYSKIKMSEQCPIIQDVYFVGADKGRIIDIYNVYRILSAQGLKCKFAVIVNRSLIDEYSEKYPGLLLFTKRIGYLDVLKDVIQSKAILELVQDGQDGMTMRFYEAVFYDKLLLTNNKNACKHKLFRNDYMTVFDSYKDLSGIKDKFSLDVRYNYNGEVSPVHLIERIKKKNGADN